MKRLFSILVIAGMVVVGAAQAKADRHDFTLFNATSVTFTHVYAAPHDTKIAWSNDLLEEDILNPNYHIGLYITEQDSYCTYDIEGVTSDGDKYFTYSDLCSNDAVYINDSDLLDD